MSTERIWTSPERFRSSVKDRLKTEAKRKGRPYNELEQEFVRQRFLARVFAAPDSPWILKGGTSMLVRLPGEARYSRDVDLLHGSETFSKAHAELGSLCDQRAASEIDGGDLFSFQLSEPEVMTGGVAGGKIMVTVYTGATVIGRFPIDLSTELTLVDPVERQRPVPIVTMPGIDPLPEFILYPLADQIADKICAMYELHGDSQAASSRYRDLVDLVLIITNFQLSGASISKSLVVESVRRNLVLPEALHVPHPTWEMQYQKYAQRTPLPREFHTLARALLVTGSCLNPVLARQVTNETWLPEIQKWIRDEG